MFLFGWHTSSRLQDAYAASAELNSAQRQESHDLHEPIHAVAVLLSRISVRNVYVYFSGFLCLDSQVPGFIAVAVVVEAVTWNQAESDEGWDAL